MIGLPLISIGRVVTLDIKIELLKSKEYKEKIWISGKIIILINYELNLL